MEMSQVLKLLDDVSTLQKKVAEQFEPFYEYMQDNSQDARTIIRIMGLVADAQGEVIQLLRSAK